MSDLKVIYRARVLHQAHLLKSLLADYGIDSFVMDPDIVGSNENPNRVPEVLVDAGNEELAVGIASLFDKHVVMNSTPLDAPALRDEISAGELVWDGWPRCPSCGEKRQTICPICQTAGNDFEKGHLPEEVTAADIVQDLTSYEHDVANENAVIHSNIILLCHGCDEPFVPRFYDHCEHCAQSFPDGRSTEFPFVDESRPLAFWIGVAMLAAFLMGLYLLATT
ncbi:MAG: hypothetical protein AAF497_21285 [Planctomycetota bacterium]